MSASSNHSAPAAPASSLSPATERTPTGNAFMRLMRERRQRRRRGNPAPWEQATIEMDVIGALYGSPQARRRAYDTQPSGVREIGPTQAAPRSSS
jgi:hypothetical protein